jgi:hypothetical protein
MQSNIDCLFTEHEFPDSWVELYNNSNEAVSLKGWRIGDSNEVNAAWILTENTTIAPPNRTY